MNARHAAGNLAIITLAEMTSEGKAVYDSLFVVQQAEFLKRFKREPMYFEYRALIDVPVEPLLSIEALGFLADSHDPDILLRLVVARNDYRTMLKIASEHRRLQLELQSSLGDQSKRPHQHARSETEFAALIGPDVMLQLRTVTENLRAILPEVIKSLQRVADDLRTVLGYQLPWRSFVKYMPEERGKLSETKSHAVNPALWRRAARSVRRGIDRIFGPRWPA
jgi:hypothetical protein